MTTKLGIWILSRIFRWSWWRSPNDILVFSLHLLIPKIPKVSHQNYVHCFRSTLEKSSRPSSAWPSTKTWRKTSKRWISVILWLTWRLISHTGMKLLKRSGLLRAFAIPRKWRQSNWWSFNWTSHSSQTPMTTTYCLWEEPTWRSLPRVLHFLYPRRLPCLGIVLGCFPPSSSWWWRNEQQTTDSDLTVRR